MLGIAEHDCGRARESARGRDEESGGRRQHLGSEATDEPDQRELTLDELGRHSQPPLPDPGETSVLELQQVQERRRYIFRAC